MIKKIRSRWNDENTFMGTPEFAVPCFDVLNSEYEIIGAFTKVDKPNMRGKKIKFTPVKEYALEHNIPVYQPNSLKTEETQNIIKRIESRFNCGSRLWKNTS